MSVVFSGTDISSTNKIDRHDITEILLKVALNSITLTLTLLVVKMVSFLLMLSKNITK